MIYFKFQLGAVEVKVDLDEGEFSSNCNLCGIEMSVPNEEIKEILQVADDFRGTSFFCKECSLTI